MLRLQGRKKRRELGAAEMYNRLKRQAETRREGREYPLPELMEEEEIKYSSDQVAFWANGDHLRSVSAEDALIGRLTITTRRLIFVYDEDGTAGAPASFAVDFQNVAIHAVASEPRVALYCQLDLNQEDETGPQEVWFKPPPDENLDDVFAIMSECALLNPDPENEEDGDAQRQQLSPEILAALMGGMEMGGTNGVYDDAENDNSDAVNGTDRAGQ